MTVLEIGSFATMWLAFFIAVWLVNISSKQQQKGNRATLTQGEVDKVAGGAMLAGIFLGVMACAFVLFIVLSALAWL